MDPQRRLRSWTPMALAMALLGLFSAHVAHAAWPDSYPGRVAAVDAMRRDMVYPGFIYDAGQIEALYDNACTLKSSSACNWKKWQGEAGGDLTLAGQAFAGACPRDPLGCVVLGWVKTRDETGRLGSKGKDPAGGARAFEQGCKEKAYAPACTELGHLYQEGIGVGVDLERSRKLLAEGCTAKDPWGCYLLGRVYEEGRGVTADLPTAMDYYEKACGDDVPHACVQLGTLVENGKVGVASPQRAAKLYGDSCKAHFAGGCTELARLYVEGNVVARSTSVAMGLFKTACDGGDIRACYELAVLYEKDEGMGGKSAEAVKVYQQACQTGLGGACARLGMMYLEGRGVAKDQQRGIDMVTRACEKGDPTSCDVMGTLYESGKGAPMNLTRAVKMYSQACDTGGAAGCYHLALLYEDGKGVDKNPSRALGLYRKSCERGDSQSCATLAHRYLNGAGVMKDMGKAAELFDLGCKGGDANACASLGAMLEQGKGIDADPARALKLFEQSCRAESGAGCFEVGRHHEAGDLVPVDFSKALNFYDRGCDLGFDKACQARVPVTFQARFEGIVNTAFESPVCQVWSYDPQDPERNVLLAEGNGRNVDVNVGPHNGKAKTFTHSGNTFETGAELVGYSSWKSDSESDLFIQHYEVWSEKMGAVDRFPGDGSFSRDRKGKTAIVYSRDDGSIRRDGADRCSFVDGYPELAADQCSEIQALLIAQELTVCKGE